MGQLSSRAPRAGETRGGEGGGDRAAEEEEGREQARAPPVYTPRAGSMDTVKHINTDTRRGHRLQHTREYINA